jgi:glycosyltransferase involved in cell wall biosynthesis
VKIVLLHDWLTGFRGGERVLEALCELYPEAPIYTLIHRKGSTSHVIESRKIVTSFLNRIPGIYKNYRKFLPFMPLAASMMKITHEADVIISSSHCVIKGVRKPKGSKHISYIHSPMRYIYDQFENYFGKASWPIKIAAHILRPYLQWWDRRSNLNVDILIANSGFIKKRIQTYYHLESDIIYPFVDLKDFREIQNNPTQKENFYLMVTAFAPNKRVDLAIEAFNDLGWELRIIGGGSEEEVSGLKQKAKPNIKFLGQVPREEVVSQMSKAKAFIFPGVEDFGITPLESLAAGTPVIAFKAGGVLETLNDDVAIFFNEPTKESLMGALKLERSFDRQILIQRAEDFSKEQFCKKIKEIVSKMSD